MSHLGQSRQFGQVPATSAYPQRAEAQQTSWHFSFGQSPGIKRTHDRPSILRPLPSDGIVHMMGEIWSS